jgi:membrane associated rhomboid family serine protease
LSFSDLRWTPTEDGSLGFLYAVLGSALFATIATVAIFLPEPDVFLSANFLLLGFLSAIVVIGITALAIGLPLTVLMAWLEWERAWTYPFAGFVTGALVILLTALLPGASRSGSLLEFASFAPVGALSGFVCGGIWWLVYRRHQQTAHER